MRWLITGGAGYIGSHIVRAMLVAGHEVVVVDDLSSGDPARVPEVPLEIGSVLDAAFLRRVLRTAPIDGVVHLAAKKQVEESVRRPLHYYQHNVEGLRVLLEEVTAAEVPVFVFSSSAAAYGAPDVDLVEEDTECRPVNPYGATKLVGERMVEAVALATGLRYACLRYFNVAGAGAPALADHGVSNLVPMVFQRLAEHLPPVVFGTDYPTPDGSCVRDFIHVEDVAAAHLGAGHALAQNRVSALTANVGRGQGVSVREMIGAIREVTGTAREAWAEPLALPRRAGDPARVVASAQRIREVLGWQAEHSVTDMVASAWAGWVHASEPERSSHAV